MLTLMSILISISILTFIHSIYIYFAALLLPATLYVVHYTSLLFLFSGDVFKIFSWGCYRVFTHTYTHIHTHTYTLSLFHTLSVSLSLCVCVCVCMCEGGVELECTPSLPSSEKKGDGGYLILVNHALSTVQALPKVPSSLL